jgi:pre-mRNA-splicing factor RBM22/SLT11
LENEDENQRKTKNAYLMKKLDKMKPNYKKNEPHVCTFFLKGECKRGDECPYMHTESKYEEK